MRLIDADALKKILNGTGCLYDVIHTLIDSVPTIAPEEKSSNNTTPITNGDYIRNMTDEKLALFLNDDSEFSLVNHCVSTTCNIELGCGACYLTWLKQPMEE